MVLARSITRKLRVAAVALAAVAAVASCSTGNADSAASPGPRFNKADITFAQTMIPHHEQAVDMSDRILAKTGVNDEVTAVAQQIKNAQGPEITTLTGLLTAWNQPLIPDHSAESDEHHWAAEGMLTPEDVQAIDAAGAPTSQRLFLQGMIQHHKGAVTMVQDEIDEGENPDAVQLAQTIKDGQTAEIQTMTKLLANLPK